LSHLASTVSEFRAAASRAGRDPKSVAVKSPGMVHVTDNVERARAGHAGNTAFYAARMGTFYAEQLTRFGFGNEVKTIRDAFNSGGAKAGTAAVPAKMQSELGYVGGVEGAIERLQAQQEAGIDIHTVEVDAGDSAHFERTVKALIG
jgi:alkanesulfonate monooxygenase SsuD/methylene tetrahydromethanopterin reductase-like flavin-dependent oxidoreductase (luciferase family)